MAARSKQKPDYSALKELFQHHIDSYNYLIAAGLGFVTESVNPVQVYDPNSNNKIRIFLGKAEVLRPQKDGKSGRGFTYPYECRQSRTSYAGKLMIDVCFQFNDGVVVRDRFNFGDFPVMLKSQLCNLRDAGPRELVLHKEEPTEMGGYFILKGLERVVRLLVIQKRNYPMSMMRSSFRGIKEGYSDKAVSIRCVRDDQSSVTVRLYYLNNGSARLGFW